MALVGEEKKRQSKADLLETQVRETLLQLMSGSESDSVRVAAAKALMDKMMQNAADSDEGRRHEEDERRAAIAEAREILAELAERLSGGGGEPVAVAADGAARTDYAIDKGS